ncbi:hypothetical protein MMC07_008662 [Pseudocyphellaria aurata]|nr:hypothetical protein [Pseudocyphellaria aurata]
METFESQDKTEQTFTRSPDEAYAGYTTTDWECIANSPEIFKSAILGSLKPVKLDDIDSANQECDICRQSFSLSENGDAPEPPVTLPCGHIFGKDCISNWIFHSALKESGDEDKTLVVFSCPKCREVHKAPRVTWLAVEARLQFWDSAYEILGIVRSAEEEEYREGLWRFVKNTKKWQFPLDRYQKHMLKLRTCVAAVQFALRRARSDLRDTQVHLRDALFNLGCFGITDAEAGYHPERYEDRQLPIWCSQYDRNERGLKPDWEWKQSEWSQDELDRWRCIGNWRRALFAEILEEGKE